MAGCFVGQTPSVIVNRRSSTPLAKLTAKFTLNNQSPARLTQSNPLSRLLKAF